MATIFGKILRGAGKVVSTGATFISKALGGGGGMPSSFGSGSLVGKSVTLPSGSFSSVGVVGGVGVSDNTTIVSPEGKSGGGFLGDVTNFLGSANGVVSTISDIGTSIKDLFSSGKETVDKVGGALDVISGNKPIQIEASTSNIPQWLFPLLGGLLAILLIKPILKRS